jgi:hypothetical protein
MADYKETAVNGTQWQRCNNIYIQNDYGQTPRITLSEEQITVANGQVFQQTVGALDVVFDPSAVIELINPADNTPLGVSMTQGQIHVALYSLYMQQAALRDAS